MVAVVAGNGLGLADTSALLLGARGVVGEAAAGRGNDRVYLNAATGNLVIQSRDEFLLGRGLDIAAHRAYNSQGVFDYGNGDNWLSGLNKRIFALTGIANMTGSAVTRADWDGSEIVYRYNGVTRRYETTSGAGAHDTLTLTGSTWTWTDGDSRITETYDSLNGGRITTQRDPSGNQLVYRYDASGQLVAVDSSVAVGSAAGTVESISLAHVDGLLTEVRSALRDAEGNAVEVRRVYYAYDASRRLERVRVDLTPAEAGIGDDVTYDTRYTYEGDSRRVASISQSDGSRIEFRHERVGAEFRVVAVSQRVAEGTTRETRIAYDLVTRTTRFTDALGLVSEFGYDEANRLTRITAPVTDKPAQTLRFEYDPAGKGDLTRIVDAANNATTFEFTDQGQIRLQRDAAGNTVTRSYDASNQLISETVYLLPDTDGSGPVQPGQPVVTRYVYDASQRLRYAISAEGRVTEHRYGNFGLRVSTHEYLDLYTSTSATEATLTAWRNALVDKSRVNLTAYTYDFRGALASETRYGLARPDGIGADLQNETTRVDYIHDSAGNLLQRVTAGGAAVAEVFAYDGLNRVIRATDANHTLTLTVYDDARTETRITHADGQVVTRVYNKAGELLAVIEGTGAAAGPVQVPVTLTATQSLTPYQVVNGATSDNFGWSATPVPVGEVSVRSWTEDRGAGLKQTYKPLNYLYDDEQAVTIAGRHQFTRISGEVQMSFDLGSDAAEVNYANVTYRQQGSADSYRANAWVAGNMLRANFNWPDNGAFAVSVDLISKRTWQSFSKTAVDVTLAGGTPTVTPQSSRSDKGMSLIGYVTPAEAETIDRIETTVVDAWTGVRVVTQTTTPRYQPDYQGALGLSFFKLHSGLYRVTAVTHYTDGRSPRTHEFEHEVAYDDGLRQALQLTLPDLGISAGEQLGATLRYRPVATTGNVVAAWADVDYWSQTVSGAAYLAKIDYLAPGEYEFEIALSQSATLGYYYTSWSVNRGTIGGRFTVDGSGAVAVAPATVHKFLSTPVQGTSLLGYFSDEQARLIESITAQVTDVATGRTVQSNVATAPYLHDDYDGRVNLSVGTPLAAGRYRVELSARYFGSGGPNPAPFEVIVGAPNVDPARTDVTLQWAPPTAAQADRVVVRYRRDGEIDYRLVDASTEAGASSARLQRLASGNHEYVIEALNSAGQVVASASGTFIAGEVGSRTETLTFTPTAGAVSANALTVASVDAQAAAGIEVLPSATRDVYWNSRESDSANDIVLDGIRMTTTRVGDSAGQPYLPIGTAFNDESLVSLQEGSRIYQIGSNWMLRVDGEKDPYTWLTIQNGQHDYGYEGITGTSDDTGMVWNLGQRSFGRSYFNAHFGRGYIEIDEDRAYVSFLNANSRRGTMLGGHAAAGFIDQADWRNVEHIEARVTNLAGVVVGTAKTIPRFWSGYRGEINLSTVTLSGVYQVDADVYYKDGRAPVTRSFKYNFEGDAGLRHRIALPVLDLGADFASRGYALGVVRRHGDYFADLYTAQLVDGRFTFDVAQLAPGDYEWTILLQKDLPPALPGSYRLAFPYAEARGRFTIDGGEGITTTSADFRVVSERLPATGTSVRGVLPQDRNWLGVHEVSATVTDAATGRVISYARNFLQAGREPFDGRLNLSVGPELGPGRYRVDLSTDYGPPIPSFDLAIGVKDYNHTLTWSAAEQPAGTTAHLLYRRAGSAGAYTSAPVQAAGAQRSGVITKVAEGDWEFRIEYRNAQGVAVKWADGLVSEKTVQQTALPFRFASDAPVAPPTVQTRYAYDAIGRLRDVQDPTGRRVHMLYDDASRKVAEIDADGSLTEFIYDARNLLVGKLRYANRLSAAVLASLTDDAGNPRPLRLGNPGSAASATLVLRPAPDPTADRYTIYVHDTAGRLVREVGADGAVVDYAYDGASRLARRTAWASPLIASAIAALRADPMATVTAPVPDPQNDRVTRYFYDRDGRERGVLDAEGYLIEHVYNGAGQRIQTRRYADLTAVAQRGSGTLADLVAGRGTPQRARDIVERFAYDGRGLLRQTVDGEGNLTTLGYDAYGNLREQVSGFKLPAAAFAGSSSATSLSFEARAESGSATLQVRIDGRVVGSVAVSGTGLATYTVPVGSLVLLGSRAVDIVYAADTGSGTAPRIHLKNLRLGGASLAGNGVTASFDAGVGTAAFDGIGSSARLASQEQVLDANGALRLAVPIGSMAAALAQANGAVEVTRYEYSPYGQLLSKTRVLASGQTEADRFRYDARRRLVGSTRAEGSADERGTALRYDSRGRVTTELGGGGMQALAALGAQAPAAAIDAVWRDWAVSYRYDDAGRRIAATDANGYRTLYFHNDDGQLAFMVRQSAEETGLDASGNPAYAMAGEVVAYAYNAFNELRETVTYSRRLPAAVFAALNGGAVTHALKAALAAIADPERDARTQVEYTVRGQVRSRSESVSAVEADTTTFEYNAFGDETRRLVPTEGGNTVEQVRRYSQRGELERMIVDPSLLALTTQTIYDAFGRVVSTVDAGGVTRRTGYDRAGRVITLTDGNGRIETLAYDARGNLISRKDKLNQITTYAYSAFNRELVVTTPEGLRTVTQYNAQGQLTRQRIAGTGIDTVWEYDRDGNVVRTIAANGSLNLVSKSAYDRAGRLWQTEDARGSVTEYRYDPANRVLTRSVDPSGLNLVTRYRYDGRGQTVRVTDPGGGVTLTRYDAKGQKVEVTTDPDGLNLRTRFSYDKRGNTLTVTEGDGSDAVRITRYQYDAAGRLALSVIDPDGLRIGTSYGYDANGNVVARTDARGNTTLYTYDNENRLRYTLDPAGALTETAYDAAGRVQRVTRHAILQPGAISLALTQGLATTAVDVVRTSSNNRVISYVYDRDDRLVFTLDALGGVTERVYDAAGNLAQTIQYANRIATSTALTVDAFRKALVADPAFDRRTRFVFDEANRLVYTIDALGGVSETVYDAASNVSRTIQWVTPVDLPGLPGKAAVAVALSQREAARESFFTYDAANRLRHSATAYNVVSGVKQFAVTEHAYDAAGRTLRTTRYATPLADADLAALPSDRAVQARLDQAARPSADRSERFAYDGAGRLQQRTLAEQRNAADPTSPYLTESYTYWATGETRSFTNAAGATWQYFHDKAGRLARERSPEIEITGVLAAGTTTVAGGRGHIETVMTYDGLGNVLTRTEGRVVSADGTSIAALTNERTTAYEYDAMGRQTRTTQHAVGVQTAADGAPGARSETVMAIASEVVYNAFGEAIISRTPGQRAGDPALFSYKTYDKLGRVEFEIDGNDNVTRHSYARVSGAAPSPVASTGRGVLTHQYVTRMGGLAGRMADSLTLGEDRIAAAASLAASANDRSILTVYDKLGRSTRVSETSLAYSVDTASGRAGNWERRREYEYNRFGDAVRVRQLLAQADAANPNDLYADTWNYHDLSGKLWRTIDAERYLTERSYNAFGELDEAVEYAERLPAGSFGAGNPGSVTTPAVGLDRRTRYAYDRRGNLLRETQVDVEFGQGHDGLPYYPVGNVVTERAYDEVGRMVLERNFTTDAAGNRTSLEEGQSSAAVGSVFSEGAILYSFHDALGRLTGRMNASGALERNEYDALGNAVRVTRHAAAPVVTFTEGRPVGFTFPKATVSEPGGDQVTLRGYDKLGRLVRESVLLEEAYKSYFPARWADTFFSYTSRGDVAAEWRPFTDLDNAQRVAARSFRYDAVGRQTETRTLTQRTALEPATWASERATYNSFGEITARLRDGVSYETNRYDAAGRLWWTNSGDAVARVHRYDLAGNAVQELRGAGAASVSSPATLPAAASTRVTTSTYDRLGRLVRQVQPSFTSTTLGQQVPVVEQTFDRWGNVLTSSRAGATTEYRYNRLNQVTDIRLQKVRTVDALGQVEWVQPRTQLFYDAWGRKVREMDTYGRAISYRYSGRGDLLAEIRLGSDGSTIADDSYTFHVYDKLGRRVRTYDGTADGAIVRSDGGRDYRYTYDLANRLLGRSVTAYEWKDGWQASSYQLGSYVYDELGNRIAEIAGHDEAVFGARRDYWFDARGKLVRAQLPGGPQFTTEYWYDSAGRKTRERDANGNEQSWTWNALTGRLDSSTDMGVVRGFVAGVGNVFTSVVTTYRYTGYGELDTVTSTRGKNLKYTYYENGLVKTINDYARNSGTFYDYDLAGNRTRDRFWEDSSSVFYRDNYVEYDALGRVTRLVNGGGGVEARSELTLNFDYDAIGNRRRVWGSAVNDSANGLEPATGERQPIDLWYTHDAANRVLINGGRFDAAASRITPVDSGEYFTYNFRGERSSESVAWTHAGELRTQEVTYNYDFTGRLLRSWWRKTGGGSNGAWNPLEVREYNAGLRTMTVTNWSDDGRASAFGSLPMTSAHVDRKLITVTEYDSNGRVSKTTDSAFGLTAVTEKNPDTGLPSWRTSEQSIIYDKVGNVTGVSVKAWSVDERKNADYSSELKRTVDQVSTHAYTYAYALFDGYRESAVSVESRYPGGSVTGASTATDYDVNGQVLQVRAATDPRWIVTDNAGQVVERRQIAQAVAVLPFGKSWRKPANPPQPSVTPTGPLVGSSYRRFHTLNDQAVGRREWQMLQVPNDLLDPPPFDPNPPTPTPDPWTPPDVDAGYPPPDPWRPPEYDFAGSAAPAGFAAKSGAGAAAARPAGARPPEAGWRVELLDTTVVNDAQGLKPNAAARSGTARSYVVRSGDTLEGIAAAQYGDAQLWWVIAQANALEGRAALVEGSTLQLPQVSRSANGFGTYAPANPAEAIGSTVPQAVPPPPPSRGCGTVGLIIMIVVAVVVTAITAAAAAPAIAQALGVGMNAGVSALAGAVGAAAGSMASQGVGMVLGVQQDFSWRQVGLAALGGAVSGALGGIPGTDGSGLVSPGLIDTGAFARVDTLLGMAQRGGQAMLSNAITQGLAVATGLQDRYQWRQVAASAFAAPVGQLAGAYAAPHLNSFGASLAGGLSSGLIRAVIYNKGKVDYASIAADAFGNAIGNSVVAEMQESGDWNSIKQQEEIARQADNPMGQVDNIALTVASVAEAPDNNPINQSNQIVDLGDGSVRLPNGRVIQPGVNVGDLRIPDASAAALGPRPAGYMNGNPFYASETGERMSGVPFDTKVPVFGRVTDSGGTPLTYSFDPEGRPYWRDGDQYRRIPVPYALPTLAELALADPNNPFARMQLGQAFGDFALMTATGVAGIASGGAAFTALRAAGAGLLSSGMTAGVVGDVTVQAGDNVAWAASRGQYGRYGIGDTELLISAGLGALPGVPGAVRAFAADLRGIGVPDWRIRLTSPQPGTLYSNPVPVELERISVQASQPRSYLVGPHGQMPTPRPSGHESHHGVNDIWLRNNFSDIDAAWLRSNAPAVLMPTAEHNATRSVFNQWRGEIADRQGVGRMSIDWKKVSPDEIRNLSERQFAATNVPYEISNEYFRQFNEFVKALKNR